MSLFNELKRRNVFRVGIAYVIVGWLVAQVAQLAAESFSAPDWVMKMLLTVLVIGLPLVLIFAWAFEMTPEGLKREKDVDRAQSITPQTGRRLDRMIIGVLAVALAYFAIDKFVVQHPAPAPAQPQETAAAGPRSLAVLPFVNMSADAENEYFSDGLTEEVLNILAQIRELQVAGRTSSFAFKGKNEDLRSIGQKLNVDSILEGSVRKDPAGKRVRITVQLVNAENGYHLWSQTYDRDLNDIFAIQEDIAREVAQALRVTLLGEETQRIAGQSHADLNAYDLYLQGLKQLADYSFASLRQAETLFGQAIERDPTYLPAQLKLAQTRMELADTGALSNQKALDLARPALRQVLEQDPDNSQAHVLMAQAHSLSRDDRAAEQELQKALDLNPRNVDALRDMGGLLRSQGQVSRGTELLKEAERLDPYSVKVLWDLVMTGVLTAQPEQAETYARRIGEIQPDNPMQYYGPGYAWNLAGDLPRAMSLFKQSEALDPDDPENPAGLAMGWTALGDIDQAEAWARRADALGADQPVPIMARVQMHLYREQYSQAADLARRALQEKLDDRQRSEHFFRQVYATWLVDQGKVGEALDVYRSGIPEAFEQPLKLQTDLPYDAGQLIEIAILLKMQDPDSERAAELLDVASKRLQLRESAWVPASQSFDQARLAMARGDKSQAIKQLYKAWDQHFRLGWRHIDYFFMFRGLHDEPDYQRLMAMVDADMEQQRERAYETVGVLDE